MERKLIILFKSQDYEIDLNSFTEEWDWAIPENVHTPAMDDIENSVVNARCD